MTPALDGALSPLVSAPGAGGSPRMPHCLTRRGVVGATLATVLSFCLPEVEAQAAAPAYNAMCRFRC
jgi:hypothetical protein